MSIERSDAARRERIRRMVARLREPRVVWSIGIYTGDSALHVRPAENAANPVLAGTDVSDIKADFVADPFILTVDSTWYMFFEVMNGQRGEGEIGLATSVNGLNWTYRQIVLVEPFHLSYPYVFAWQGDYYMVPETAQAGEIRIYRATEFPFRWSFAAALLSNGAFHDASVFRYDAMWWLLTETNPHRTCDTLRLFFAEGLMGPWTEHPRSPIVAGNPHVARPAGRVVVGNNVAIRYAQDCYPAYGREVRAFEITELTTRHYREREVSDNPILAGNGRGWNAHGMHHIDPHQMEDGRILACVDGWTLCRD